MTGLSEALDDLAPSSGWGDDWADVLRRAGEDGRLSVWSPRVRRRRLMRRRTVLLAFALAAIIAPLTAVGAINHWWFLRTSLPRPAQKPIVVTRGSWSGHRWTLVAYPSKGYGLCWGVTFAGHNHRPGRLLRFMRSRSAGVAIHGADSGMGCGSIVGIPDWNPKYLPTVMFESVTTNAPGYPSWISGAVVTSATHAVIHWQSGKAVRVRTFAVPVGGYHVRLFATPYPNGLSSFYGPTSISGTNQQGDVVACFNSQVISTNGAYPLSYCKP